MVEKAIAEVINSEYPEVEILMGTSTAGIPHAAIAADIFKQKFRGELCHRQLAILMNLTVSRSL